MRGRLTHENLGQTAFVYVRQSTDAQVMEHGESTARQYGLVERAVQLGWERGAVEVIDEDLGRSGASTEGRSGFARLADAIAHGKAGAVLALEVSRLARSSNDWRHLLSLCAVAQVPVIDEQTIYDPSDRDDKLLLDLKGTMSEAELYWMALRLAGAKQNKARRGELRFQPPIGYVWTDAGLQMDPDEAVQQAVRTVFERYEVEPSAWAVIRWARQTALQFPVRRWHAGGDSEVSWKPLALSRIHELLNNPLYAGVYVWGRRPVRKALVDGQIRQVKERGRDPERWPVRLPDAHPGYISWERYVSNQRKLERNRGRYGGTGSNTERRPLLLGGLVLCGRCGRKMRAQYRGKRGGPGMYCCVGELDKGQPRCWTVSGERIDTAVEDLFLKTVVTDEVELGLAVDKQVDKQAETLAQQWRLRIEKAGYEARKAERRYKAVDPDNRVVARTLEREWEERLREVEQIERDYERAKSEARVHLTAHDRARIRELARNLRAVWEAPTTQQADRKAMLALVIEAITLQPVDVPTRSTLVRVQWKAGAIDELIVPRLGPGHERKPGREALVRLRQLAGQGLQDVLIARQLNAEGYKTGVGKSWTQGAVKHARHVEQVPRVAAKLTSVKPPARLPDGSWSIAAVAEHYQVKLDVVRTWIAKGMVAARRGAFAPKPAMQWLTIDEQTDERLKRVIARTTRAYPES